MSDRGLWAAVSQVLDLALRRDHLRLPRGDGRALARAVGYNEPGNQLSGKACKPYLPYAERVPMADPSFPTPGADDLPVTGPHEGVNAGTTPEQVGAAMRPPGAVGSRFELQEEIARGGMGAIFRGMDHSLKREIAVKIMLGDPADNPAAARRFQEEARITGQLQHPSIVPIHEIGTLADGRPFFAMKLIRGESLAKRLRQRPSPVHDQQWFLKVFEQVSQAVAYAHSQGVIHRDLKPLNVMVGAFGEVQVMDWGLGKKLTRQPQPALYQEDAHPEGAVSDPIVTVAWEDIQGGDERTRAGVALGTPAYMPPEQARGNIHLVDERADVFGLGAILCEILTGQPPYTGNGSEVLAKAAAADLTEAHSRLATCGAAPPLIALTHRCLAPDPGERFRDAADVAEAVAAYQVGVQEQLRQAELERATAEAKETEAQARAAAERKARKRALGLAAAALVLVIGGAAAGFLLSAQAAEKAAEQVRKKASAQAAVAAALDQAENWLKEGRTRETEAALLQAEKRLDDTGQGQLQQRFARLRKDLRMVKALDTIAAGSFWRERSVPGAVVAAFRRAFQEYGLDVVKMDAGTAAQLIQESMIRDRLIDALDGWLGGWLGQDSREARLALLAVLRQLDTNETRTNIREALFKQDAARLRDLVGKADVASWSPDFAFHVGDSRLLSHDDAIRLLKIAHARHPTSFNLPFAIAYRAWEAVPPRDDEAIAYFRNTLAVKPDDWSSWSLMGRSLKRKGDTAGALACFRRAMEAAPKHPSPRAGYADALREQKNLGEALTVCRQALALDANNSYSLGVLVHILFDMGKYDEAVPICRKMVALDPADWRWHSNLGRILQLVGDWQGAVAAYQKAIALRSGDSFLHLKMGLSLARSNDLDGAVASFRKASVLDPQQTNIHKHLLSILLTKQNRESALAAYRKASRLEPQAAYPHYGMGVILSLLGDRGGAVAAYGKAIQRSPNLVVGHLALARAFADNAQLRQAAASFRKVIELDPKLVEAHYQLGRVLHRSRDLDGAFLAYRAALRLAPRVAPYHHSIGLVLKGQGDLRAAAAAFRKASLYGPNSPSYFHDLGATLKELKDSNGALPALQRAAELDPRNARTQLLLGDVYQDKGDLRWALAAYRRAIALNPRYAEAYAHLTLMLRTRGVPPAATDSVGRPTARPRGKPRAGIKVKLARQSLSFKAGKPLSPITMVTRPAVLPGVISWTIHPICDRDYTANVAYSPTGMYIAKPGTDGIISLWHGDDHRFARNLVSGDTSVTGLSWSPDGNYLAVIGETSGTCTFSVWEAETGLLVHTLGRDSKRDFRLCAWSPKGNLVALGCWSGALYLWETTTGKVQGPFEGHKGTIQDLAWAPRGDSFASCSADRTILIRAPGQSKPQKTIRSPGAPLGRISWCPLRNRLAFTEGSQVKIWDLDANRLLRALKGHTTEVSGVQWSPDGTVIASCAADGTVRFWDPRTGENIKTFASASGNVWGLCWAPSGEIIATSIGAGIHECWDVRTGNIIPTLPRIPAGPQGFCWFPKGDAAAWGVDSTEIWHFNSWTLTRPFAKEPYAPVSLACSPAGKRLAVRYRVSHGILQWNLEKKSLQRTLAYQENLPSPSWDEALLLAGSADGKWLASAELGFVIQIWDTEKGIRAAALKGHTGKVLSLSWAPDNRRLVSSSRDGTTRIWDALKGKELSSRTKLATSEETPFVHWSSQGGRIAVAHGDMVDIWEAATGRVVKQLASWRVRQVAWSPDGTVLAYLSKQGLLFRSAKTWELLARQGTSDYPTPHLAWSPDGNTLALSLTNNEIRYYDGRTFQRLGTLMNFGDGRYLAVSPEGHYRASPGVEDRFVYIVQTEKGQTTLSPATFTRKYGWKNVPGKVQLLGRLKAPEKKGRN